MDDNASQSPLQSVRGWLKNTISPRSESTLKEVLEEVIEEHDEKGEVNPEERIMLHNVLDFGETTVSDIMIPRTDIIAVAHDISFDDLKAHIIEQRHTRTPVYQDTLDNVLGFLHVKDLLFVLASDKPFDIKTYLRTMLYVPPSMKLLNLLAKMRAAGSHMAIVVDEHGGTDGLVTMEDVVEEIVGEIHDEHDDDEQPDNKITRINDNLCEISARMRIDTLEEKLGLRLLTEEKEGDFDTVGGLVFYKLGRIPAKGEFIAHADGIRFEITDADPRRINRVRIHL